MEHRWNPRKEMDSRVTVYRHGLGDFMAAVKNISAEGMLVDTGQYALPKGVMVELAAAALDGLQSSLLRLRALTVHADDDGAAGLMFIGDKRNIAALFKNLENQLVAQSAHTEIRVPAGA
ncbi:MAG: hypothetical protein P8164_08565 [Gammaproteobacteria bacterium]|jgi:hypothetical protein